MGDDARKRGWATRRKKYGPKGHAGAYLRDRTSCGQCARLARMEQIIVRLYEDGVLTEGQAAKATGLHRVELRKKADEVASWREINISPWIEPPK